MQPFVFILSLGIFLGFASPGLADKVRPTPGVRIENAREKLAKNHSFSPVQTEFLRDYFLPVVGLRGLSEPLRVEANRLIWPGDTPEEYTAIVEFEHDVTAPTEVELSEKRVLLKLGKNNPFEKLDVGLLQRWLLGHRLHPFNSDKESRLERLKLGEEEYLLRWAQLENIWVGETYFDRFEDKASNAATRELYQRLLSIGPAGSGKSVVLQRHLKKRLTQILGQAGVTIVLADRTLLVRDRCDEVLALAEKLKGVHTVEWREAHSSDKVRARDQGITTVQGVLDLARKTKEPVVLVTTVQSLVSRLLETDIPNVRELLRAIFYDEGHHMAAEVTYPLLSKLLDDNPLATLNLYTATPLRMDQDFLALFEGHAFWMYLDTAESYLKNPGEIDRQIHEIAQQLKNAIDQGELTGFDEVRVLALGKSSGREKTKPLWIRPANRYRRSINPDYYDEIYDKLRDLFSTHFGIVPCADRTEALDFAQFLNRQSPTKFAEEFTHISAPAGTEAEEAILERFRKRETRILTSVTKVDEGVNLHDANLYAEFGNDPNVRKFLQREGRIGRVARGKRKGSVVLLSELDEDTLRQKLGKYFNPEPVGRGGGFRIPMKQYLGAVVDLKVKHMRFWEEPSQYEGTQLTHEQLVAFQTNIGKKATSLFSGYLSRSDLFFQMQTKRISDRSRREVYEQKLSEIDLGTQDITGCDTQILRAKRVYWALEALAEALEMPAEALWVEANVRNVLGLDLPLNPAQLHAFRQNVMSQANTLFPGYVKHAEQFFIDQAERVPEARRSFYLERIAELKIGPQNFVSAMSQDAPAQRVHRGFRVLAECLDVDPDKLWVLRRVQKLLGRRDALKAAQLQVFQTQILKAGGERFFRGFKKRAVLFFEQHAKRISTPARRKRFEEAVAEIGLKPADFSEGQKQETAAQRVYWVLQELAVALRIQVTHLWQNEHEMQHLLGLRTELSGPEIITFREQVMTQPWFAGQSVKTIQFFTDLAKLIPDEERRDAYLATLQEIGLKDVDVRNAMASERASQRLQWAFQALGEAHGLPPATKVLSATLAQAIQDGNCTVALALAP